VRRHKYCITIKVPGEQFILSPLVLFNDCMPAVLSPNHSNEERQSEGYDMLCDGVIIDADNLKAPLELKDCIGG